VLSFVSPGPKDSKVYPVGPGDRTGAYLTGVNPVKLLLILSNHSS